MGMRLPNYESRLAEARRSFFLDGKLPAGVIPEYIQRSWSRARETGMRVKDRRIFNLISPSRRAVIEERSQTIVTAALPEMEKLHASLGYGGWGLAFADCEGVVVRSVCGNGTDFRELATILEVGRDISEGAIGTNGPGCALSELHPMVIRSGEHYLEEIMPFDCVAVPVFGPDGRLHGVLDATRHRSTKAITILDAMTVAASAIENRMLFSAASSFVIAVHYCEDLLDSASAGVLGFDSEGYLAGANRVARRLLGIELDAPLPRFEELFDVTLNGFLRTASARQQGGMRLRTGNRLILTARILSVASGRSMATKIVPTKEIQPLPALAEAPVNMTEEIVDERVSKMMDVALRAFEREIPVLISGETGTGKEVLARRLHACSSRAAGPFIPINCASIPANLIESEFFGYEDGAFTGGRRGGSPGKFEFAKGGTLFLDEIGDMPIELQGRLLRVLQERCFYRLGGVAPIRFEARVVSATLRNLADRVAEGVFRQDLYYRVNGVRITLPPLRERQDLRTIVGQIVHRECAGRACVSISEEAWTLLLNYPWPGNIRQLEHALRVALVYCDDGETLKPQHFSDELTESKGLDGAGYVTRAQSGARLREAELFAVKAAMASCNGNVSAAAKTLGIARATLYRKLSQLDAAGYSYDGIFNQ